jgi:zinc resistance-associated protein
MKKVTVATLVMAFGLVLLGSAAFAGMGMGPGSGNGPCAYGAGQATAVKIDPTALRAFQKETLPLRDEVMAKRVEIRNEFTKEKPDQTKIATLQKDIIDLRAKIRTAAEKNGLPAGFGQRMAGRGHGYGMGGQGGRGTGCGNW